MNFITTIFKELPLQDLWLVSKFISKYVFLSGRKRSLPFYYLIWHLLICIPYEQKDLCRGKNVEKNEIEIQRPEIVTTIVRCGCSERCKYVFHFFFHSRGEMEICVARWRLFSTINVQRNVVFWIWRCLQKKSLFEGPKSINAKFCFRLISFQNFIP